MKSLQSKSLNIAANVHRVCLSTSKTSYGDILKELEEKLRSNQIESERRQDASQRESERRQDAVQKEFKDDLRAAQKEFKEDFKASNAEQLKSFEVSIILKLSSAVIAAISIFEYFGFYIHSIRGDRRYPD